MSSPWHSHRAVARFASTSIGTEVPAELGGTAAGVLNTAARLGTALGIAAIFVLAQATAAAGWALSGSYLGWCCSVALAVAGAIALGRAGSGRAVGAQGA